MKSKRFKALKGLMYANDIRQEDLAEITKRGRSYVTTRICNKAPWSLDDIYAICDALHIPDDQVTKYFPREGQAV